MKDLVANGNSMKIEAKGTDILQCELLDEISETTIIGVLFIKCVIFR